MKVFEVAIKKDRTPDQCKLTWPEWWGEVYQKVDVVAYQDEGKATEGAVCVTDEDTWKTIAAKKDSLITPLTATEANTKGRAWRQQVARVTDEQKVLLITAKAASGKALSADEKKALDPEDPTPGIGKSRLFDVDQIVADKGGSLSEAAL
jgi:hypothetical protein